MTIIRSVDMAHIAHGSLHIFGTQRAYLFRDKMNCSPATDTAPHQIICNRYTYNIPYYMVSFDYRCGISSSIFVHKHSIFYIALSKNITEMWYTLYINIYTYFYHHYNCMSTQYQPQRRHIKATNEQDIHDVR